MSTLIENLTAETTPCERERGEVRMPGRVRVALRAVLGSLHQALCRLHEGGLESSPLWGRLAAEAEAIERLILIPSVELVPEAALKFINEGAKVSLPQSSHVPEESPAGSDPIPESLRAAVR